MGKFMKEYDYDKIESYLKKFKYKDFEDGTIKKAITIDEMSKFKIVPKNETVINYGECFLVDILGNDISIVMLTKRKYKAPNGRMVNAKFIKTIISDCKKQYGSCVNGYWSIPEEI